MSVLSAAFVFVMGLLIILWAWPGFEACVEWMGWWSWRRWQNPCPPRDISHLFNSRHELGPTLFDYDEQFISPCTFNEVNCGAAQVGKWMPRIGLIGMEMPDNEDDEPEGDR